VAVVYRTLFPASGFLIMCREIVAVGKSLYRLTLTDPWLRLVWIVGRLSGRMTTMSSDTYGNLCSRVGSLDSDLTFGILMAAIATEAYLDARRRGLDIGAVRYEDLVARPLDTCRARRVVLAFCRLPASLAQLAVRALDVDSQRDSIVHSQVEDRAFRGAGALTAHDSTAERTAEAVRCTTHWRAGYP